MGNLSNTKIRDRRGYMGNVDIPRIDKSPPAANYPEYIHLLVEQPDRWFTCLICRTLIPPLGWQRYYPCLPYSGLRYSLTQARIRAIQK
jgi:hypothetical protein